MPTTVRSGLGTRATGPGPPDNVRGRGSSALDAVDLAWSLPLSEDAESERSLIIAPPDKCGGVIGRLPDLTERADLLECEDTPEKGRDNAILVDILLPRGFADPGDIGVAAVEPVVADQ